MSESKIEQSTGMDTEGLFHAFFVWNSTFKEKSGLKNLPFKPRAAEEFKQTVVNNGYMEKNVSIVSDLKDFDQLSENLNDPIAFENWLGTQDLKGGTVVMSISTHGVRYFGEPALCFRNTKYNSVSEQWENVMTVADLGKALRDTKAKNILLILNACHGGFNDCLSTNDIEGFVYVEDPPKFLTKAKEGESINGFYVLTSTSPSEQSHSDSCFMDMVRDYLGGRYVTEEGFVSASLLVTQVCEDMPKLPAPTAWRMNGSIDFNLSPITPPEDSKRTRTVMKRRINEWMKKMKKFFGKINVKYEHLSKGYQEIDHKSDELNDTLARMNGLVEIVKKEAEGMDTGGYDYSTPDRIVEYQNRWDSLYGELEVETFLQQGRQNGGQKVKPNILVPPIMSSEQRCLKRQREVSELVERLSKTDSSILGIVGVKGMGGIGKTVLAYHLYHDSRVKEQFGEHRFWITIGETVNDSAILKYQTEVYQCLSGNMNTTFPSIEDARIALEGILADSSCLIVLDDVWDSAACRRFGGNALSGESKSKILVTTRDSNLLGPRSKEMMYELNYLNRDEAIDLLGVESGLGKEELKKCENLDSLLKECGNNPLPLVVSVVGGMIGQTNPYCASLSACLVEVTGLIHEKGLAKEKMPRDDGDKILSRVLLSSLDVLSRDSKYHQYDPRSLFLDLSVFPEDYDIPVALVEWLWSKRGVPTGPISRDLVRKMCSLSLMKHQIIGEEKKIVKLHDSVRKFAESAVEDMKTLHRFLIHSYLSGCDNDELWWKCTDSPVVYEYMLGELSYHLNLAESHDRIFELIMSFEWIWERGVYSVMQQDCGYLSEIEEYRGTASLMESALSLSLRAMSNHRDRGELAFQLYGRLRGIQDERIKELIDGLRDQSCLELVVGETGIQRAGGPLVRIMKGHTNLVNSIAVSPDGKHIVSGSWDNTVRVWDFATGECKSVLEGHTNRVYSVAVSPDGKHIVSGSRDNTVRVWDFVTGECKSVLKGHTSYVTSVAVSPDGKHIVSGSCDKTVRVWDFVTGECKSVLKGHTNWVNSVAVSPDGNHIVSGSNDNTVRVWGFATGECKSVLERHTSAVYSVAVSPDGNHIVSGSRDKTVRVWDFATGECKSVLEEHTDDVDSVAVSPDGKHIVSGSEDHTVRVWKFATGECKSVLENIFPRCLVFCRDSNHFVAGCKDGSLRLLRVASSRADTGVDVTSMVVVNSVAVSPEGKHIVSGSDDKTVRVWDFVTGECKSVLEGHTSYVYSVAVSPDGKHIVSGSDDNTVRVWDFATGECKSVLEGHTNNVISVAVSPDGKHIVSGSDDHTVRVWDFATGECKSVLEGHTSYVNSVAVSPDGKHIVSGSWDKTVRVWDFATGECKSVLKAHTSNVISVAVSPDGKHIVSGSDDNTVRVWDFATGECKSVLEGHTNYVYSVAVSPDGKHIVSGSADNTVRVWDVETGETVFSRCFDFVVTSVAIRSDRIVVGVGDGFAVIRVDLLRDSKVQVR